MGLPDLYAQRAFRWFAMLGSLPVFLLLGALEWWICCRRVRDEDFWDLNIKAMRNRSSLGSVDK